MENLLKQARGRYDLIVIETPAADGTIRWSFAGRLGVQMGR
jgi:Mrp family chromosome partitioning ATPase